MFRLVFAGLLACSGGKDSGETGPSTTDSPVNYPPPVVAIASPEDGATTDSADVEVIVDLEGFTLDVSATSASLGPLPLLSWASAAWAHEADAYPTGVVAWTLDGAEVARTATDRYTFAALDPGEHVVEVELLWSDGDAFYPAVTDDVAFTVP